MSYITADNVSLDLPIIGAARSFRSHLLVNKVGGLLRVGSKAENEIVKVQALKDLTFRLERGDRLGLIGHNGAGKSTLLRVLAGTYRPTSGSLKIKGNVMPLLSLGSGMDGDFTGYDNIMLYGLYLGLSRQQIAARTREIADFTELGDFLSLPIRTYSAGMLLRLSFAVATSMDPEILLVDEIFGAGDASFYVKAKHRMETMLEKSSILVLATHSVSLITDYCNKTGVMQKGQMAFFGPTAEAIEYYKKHIL